MDLIQRYVLAIRVFLPREQRDDIVRELSEDLRSQAADREAELGRPLSDEEQAGMLKQYGHPMLMAARYRPVRHLIGPVLFPHYWLALKVVLVLVALGHVVAVADLAAAGASLADFGILAARLLRNVSSAVLVLTLVAAFVEWLLSRHAVLERWDPASLGRGPARLAARAAGHAAQHARRTPGLVRRALDEAGPPMQVRSASQFIVLSVLSVWGLLALQLPFLVSSTAGMLDWLPVVDRAFPFLVVVFAAVLADQYFRLIGSDNRFVRFMRILWANSGWVLVLLLLIADHQWVAWVGTREQWTRLGVLFERAGGTWSIVDVVNYAISGALVVIALACLLGSHMSLRRFRVLRQRRTAQA